MNERSDGPTARVLTDHLTLCVFHDITVVLVPYSLQQIQTLLCRDGKGESLLLPPVFYPALTVFLSLIWTGFYALCTSDHNL